MKYGNNNSVCSNYVLFTELLVLHRNSFINPWKFTACTRMPVCQVTIDTCTPAVTLHTNCQLQLLITAKQCTDTVRHISALSGQWCRGLAQPAQPDQLPTCHGKLGVHQLTQLLHCEADCVTLQVALVPEMRLASDARIPLPAHSRQGTDVLEKLHSLHAYARMQMARWPHQSCCVCMSTDRQTNSVGVRLISRLHGHLHLYLTITLLDV